MTISRIRESEIANGNLINADDIGAEFDQLICSHNAMDARLAELEKLVQQLIEG